mmetsp:Transcript_51113/g.101710  ORF Transcript_51113/g.101710 Transcript_51113/m.101710 type:complete len:209 (-) Transcript_51113:131-757(-)
MFSMHTAADETHSECRCSQRTIVSTHNPQVIRHWLILVSVQRGKQSYERTERRPSKTRLHPREAHYGLSHHRGRDGHSLDNRRRSNRHLKLERLARMHSLRYGNLHGHAAWSRYLDRLTGHGPRRHHRCADLEAIHPSGQRHPLLHRWLAGARTGARLEEVDVHGLSRPFVTVVVSYGGTVVSKDLSYCAAVPSIIAPLVTGVLRLHA